ncbi:DUF500-domain-containing protein [Mytilinidion resinicola]|uniref:DUF500-domain-containing protein n=1 Tax=Mytilinidion resinicola TaxID=574789 RepID=A0A6A6XZ82_9PEZI|nr:DUF500-domain-containing protein [Mytilinidion resinicola]KAF2801720.1 DUF500-domain-containing protein [Mytilinidion resinicola]
MVEKKAIWAKTKTGGKAGFDKLWGWADKLGAPVNRLSNKLGSEAFWPTTLDKECDKAARILRSFCKDGFYQEEEVQPVDGPKKKQKVLKRIPPEVIKNAKGLAIFTTMRTGLWVSGAGGSGILVGRKEDGEWSPPSGILLHTAGLGFLVGVDIYDCVVVINSQKALDAFSKVRCTLGGEISAVAGPVGIGGVLESEVHKRQSPIFTYLKSRGFYAGVQIDGTIVIERTDENEAFYHDKIGVADILAGKVRNPPYEIKTLMETIKAAQGDRDVDQNLLTDEPPPGDYEVEEDGVTFGIPDKEDPDPFGVLALEEAGFEIREAGTKKRPTSEQFEFNPSPSSPVYNAFRKSTDRHSFDSRSISRRTSWRTSTMSTTVDRGVQTMDMSTQTEMDPPSLPQRTKSVNTGNNSPRMTEIPENKSTDDATKTAETPSLAAVTAAETSEDTHTEKTVEKSTVESTENALKKHTDGHESPDEGDDFDNLEEPVIHQIHHASTPQVITRARVVQVVKPIPPKLPPRNPVRDRKSALSINPGSPNEHSTNDQATGTSSFSSSGRPSPSSLHDRSSVRSQDSISSADDGLEAVAERFKPHDEPSIEKGVTPGEEKKDNFHSLPESPAANHVPGGFN